MWLDKPRDCALEHLFSADFVDHTQLDALILKVQRADPPNLPLAERTQWVIEHGAPRLEHKHGHAFREQSLRRFITSLSRILRCFQDIQYDLGGGALLRYVPGYLTKHSESLDREWLDQHGGFGSALPGDRLWRPAILEQIMVLTRSAVHFTCVTKRKYRPPLPQAPDDDAIRLYRQRDEDFKDHSMLQWMREVVIIQSSR